MTTLYLAFDGDDLLYVGITDHLSARLRAHKEKLWWADVTRVETVEYSERTQAAAAEIDCIARRKPRYNKSHRVASVVAEAEEPGEYLSMSQAALRAGVSARTIRRYIATGQIEGFRFGPRLVRVRWDALESALIGIPNAKAGYR